MRIAVIVTSFPVLSNTFILDQITGLIDRGHQVDIFADRPGNLTRMHHDVTRYDLLARTHYPQMPRHLLPRLVKGAGLLAFHGWRHPGPMLRSLNVARYGVLAASGVLCYTALPLLEKRRYDIVHAHFGPNGLKGVFLLETGLLEGKLITTFHGYDVNVYPRRYGSKVYKHLFERGDFYTANTHFTMRRAIELGCPPDGIITLPVGVKPSRFPFVERTVEPQDEVRVLTVGRLVEVKGVAYLIRAVAKIATRCDRIRLDIAGDGPLMKPLKRLSRSVGIADRVRFLGGRTRDQLREDFARAHLFVLPSIVGRDGAQEGQGLVLLEAQASGLPVVATRTGGIAECLIEGQSGYLVEQRDVNALAGALTALIEDPQRWFEMGQAGRRFVEQHFDIEQLNDRLVEIYRRVLG